MQCLSCSLPLVTADLYCPECGEPYSERLLAFPLDARRIWLGEILESRYVARFSANSLYVLSDALGRPDEELRSLPGFGPNVMLTLENSIADVERDVATLREQIENRAGTCFDPIAPILRPDHERQIDASGHAPDQLPIRLLDIANSTNTLFRKARIQTFADLAGLTNLTLIRRLRPRMPDVIVETSEALDSALVGLARRAPESGTSSRPGRAGESTQVGLARLAEGIAQLDERPRLVLTRRYGLDGTNPQTLEDTGQALGVTRERARQIESRAIAKLTANRLALSTARLELLQLANRTGIQVTDERFAMVVRELGGPDLQAHIALLPLTLKVLDLTADSGRGDSEFDAAVVALLAGGQRLTLDDLAGQIETLLDDGDPARNAEFDVAARLRLLGPAVEGEDQCWSLPPERIAGVNDKRIRRIQTMRMILEEHGPSHYSFVAAEMKNRLPEDYWLDERGVQSWFSRLTSIFIWAGRGTYGLKSHGVGIRKEVEMTALDGSYRSQTSRRKGIGEEIAAYLRENGPTPLEDIEGHILSRFTVQPSSVYAAITQDKAGRFQFDTQNKVCALRPAPGLVAS